MLDDALKAQLTDALQRLKHAVALTPSLDDSETSAQIQALLADVASTSPLVSVEAPDPGARAPSFAIHRPGEPGRVRFAGLPMGHEFTSLVLALLHVGGHPPRASEETLSEVRGLTGPLHFETFFSQDCQNCPDVVQALDMMAALHPGISHVAIDGAAARAEVEARGVMAVPTVFLNGEPFGQGRMELSQILAKLDGGLAAREAAKLDDKPIFDMLVVGGGPAGAAAAIYAARKGIETGVVADRFGGQVADTLGIENYISVVETVGPHFVGALEAHVGAYPVDVMKHQRAAKLVPGEVHEVQLESGASLRARSVVIATGARWRDMGVPGEAAYRNKGVTYCPHCDGPLFAGKRVAVIGGGNSGVEAAIDLAGVVAHVTLLELMPALRADAVLQRKLRSLPNVDVITNARTTEVVGDGAKVTGLAYEDTRDGSARTVEVAGVFVQIGLLPNTGWLRGTLALSPHGEIVVDDRGATSIPGVYAAGDVTTVPFKQIIIAAGDGAKAALGAFDHLIRATAPAA